MNKNQQHQHPNEKIKTPLSQFYLTSFLVDSLLIIVLFFSSPQNFFYFFKNQKMLNMLAFSHTAIAAESSKTLQQPADSLLKESDRARGAAQNSEGISWLAKIHSEENEKISDIEYIIKVRGDNALAEAQAPPINKGQITLFNNRNVWFYKVGLKKPIAISPRQKLMGQAANGDIASTNYARDYSAKIVAEEKINGIETFKLELKAKAKDVTYDQIIYWISKDKRLGIKADFLTVNGETFKQALFEYNNQLNVQGKSFPFVSKMIITDAKNQKNSTVFLYEKPHAQSHSPHIFNVNNIIR